MDVCVAVPRLALDRPFTYLLREEDGAGTGSLVSVPFHGRTVKGWVLGPTTGLPSGRLLDVRKVRSPVRFFDTDMLALLRWVSERYVSPLGAVIERSHPPRVASEEALPGPVRQGRELVPTGPVPAADSAILARYGGASVLQIGATWLRPLPHEEADACVASVRACLASGRQALVLVPEADPLPGSAKAVLQALGRRAVGFIGGDARERYRTWLDIQGEGYDVVVSTRPGVFAPLTRPGLIWVSREVHPGHREDRAPYYHVRDVAMARAELTGAACVLASLSPSVATASAVDHGRVRAARPSRPLERVAAPLVETAPPEAEDRSSRLASLLKEAGSGALVVSRRGYGVARVCRSCGQPAACAVCHGTIVVQRGVAACRVCGAPGTCGSCGGTTFGIERGGTERVAQWAGRAAAIRVDLEDEGRTPPVPGPGRLVVGTASCVKDVGPLGLDLVAILDPDRALARPGVQAGEQALATWMEAAAWAAPREAGGRVLLQSRRPGHPAIQALVRWEPIPFLLGEAARRLDGGFPVDHPVFRVEGAAELQQAVARLDPVTLLATTGERGTICLVAVRPADLPAFRREVLRLAAEGVVERVEAEPQL